MSVYRKSIPQMYEDKSQKQEPKLNSKQELKQKLVRLSKLGGSEISKFIPDTVLPRLYLGDLYSAINAKKLRELGVTHIVNCSNLGKDAEFFKSGWPDWAFSSSKHEPSAVPQYITIAIKDSDSEPISQYFAITTKYIHECISNGGRCLVHCQAGVSRSVTIVLAYLITQRNMLLDDAFNMILTVRPQAMPIPNFAEQLLQLHHQVHLNDYYNIPVAIFGYEDFERRCILDVRARIPRSRSAPGYPALPVFAEKSLFGSEEKSDKNCRNMNRRKFSLSGELSKESVSYRSLSDENLASRKKHSLSFQQGSHQVSDYEVHIRSSKSFDLLEKPDDFFGENKWNLFIMMAKRASSKLRISQKK
ncbi:hypothetical protein HK096_005274 [Nowakowskiella sp. JEL0078]|nr:hypothetical protein HK096_005274 [Nowakowskiella sp. JEL0078]